jgi:DNA-binding NarL/FixJ family response regulator
MQEKPLPIKAFIVDDNLSFRKMLKLFFEETGYIKIIGESDREDDFLEKIKNEEPDIVTMDIKLIGGNGIDATKSALKQKPDIKIIAISMYDEEIYYRQMYDAGAWAFLSKSQVFDHLEKVINQVANGEKYFPTFSNNN